MAKILLPISWLFSLAMLLSSCDPCFRTECINGGICVDGKCLCADGEERSNCSIDPCIYTECNNEGTCEDGTCNCPEFYNGESCDIYIIDTYIEDYSCRTSCDSPFYNYTVSISDGYGAKDLRFTESYYGTTFNVTFTTASDFTISEPSYVIGYYSYYYVSGSGTITDSSLTFNVTYSDYSDDSNVFTCNFEEI